MEPQERIELSLIAYQATVITIILLRHVPGSTKYRPLENYKDFASGLDMRIELILLDYETSVLAFNTNPACETFP